MAAAASVAWFLEACGASPLRAPSATAAKAAARAHAEPPYDVPFDIVVLICMAAWQCDANAPLLAAINHKFKAASAEAATNVTTIDVMPRRANVTIPKNDSIDPEHGEDVVKFREELSRWGLRLEHYEPFRVLLPHASKSNVITNIEKKTIANVLDLGSAKGYLDNITIDAFFSTIMPSIFDVAKHIEGGGQPPKSVFLPCFVSAGYRDNDMWNSFYKDMMDALRVGFAHVDEIYQPFHFGETKWRENHWVLVRLKKSVLKVETFESAALVKDNALAELVLEKLIKYMHPSTAPRGPESRR